MRGTVPYLGQHLKKANLEQFSRRRRPSVVVLVLVIGIPAVFDYEDEGDDEDDSEEAQDRPVITAQLYSPDAPLSWAQTSSSN
jgi:hypothetical protein